MLEAAGSRLREERIRLGATQEQFAEWGGLRHRNSQRGYEKGATPCNIDYLYSLAGKGVDIGYVLTGRRSDGSLGFSEQHHLDMLSKLSMREREAVFGLVATLAGETVSLKEIDLANIGQTLHSKGRDFRGEGD